MNNNAGEAVFIIKLDTKQAQAGLESWQQNLNSSMSSSKQSTESLASGFDDLRSSIASLATAGVAFAGLTSGINSVVDAYNNYQSAMNGVKAVAKATGNDVTASLESIRSVTSSGLITQEDAAAAMKNLQLYGYSVDEATKMINIMTDAAVYNRQANYSVSESVRVTTEGIRMENSVLSDASGVTKNIAKMHQEYAASLGTTADKLTDAQKAQAVYNGYMEEGGIFAGNAAEYTNSLAGAQQKLSTAVRDVKQTLGAMFENFAPIISGMADWISENKELVAKIITTIGILVAGGGLVAAIRTSIKAIGLISSALLKMGVSSSLARGGIMGLVLMISSIAAGSMVSSAIDSINEALFNTDDAADDTSKSVKDLGNTSEDTADKISKLNDQLSKLERDYRRDLKSIAVSHKENLAKLTQQIEEANVDYRRAIDERIADFNVSMAKEERAHQETVNELMTQLNFLQRYNNDYNRQKLSQVKAALAVEQTLYEKQTQAEKEQLELQNEQDRQKRDQKVASLQKELDDEMAFMDKHRDALNSVRDVILLDEIESLNERYAEQKASYEKQIAEAKVSGKEIGYNIGYGVNDALESYKKDIEEVANKLGNIFGDTFMGKVISAVDKAFSFVTNFWTASTKAGMEAKDEEAAVNSWVEQEFKRKYGSAWKEKARAAGYDVGYATGGFTGRGNPDEVAGVVHKGEYVIPADQVNQNTGLPKAQGNTTVQNVTINLSGVLATSAQAKRELATELQRALQQTNQARFA